MLLYHKGYFVVEELVLKLSDTQIKRKKNAELNNIYSSNPIGITLQFHHVTH